MAQRTAFDAIIVGAGSVGVPAAWAMALAGLRILVLDGLRSACQGSNKTAIGGIRATHSEPAKIRICLRSLEIASTWEDTYGDPIDWRAGGYAFLAYAQSEAQILQELVVPQQASGLSIAWHDAEELLSIIPVLRREGLLGGTFAPGDGICSPLLLGHAIYEQARRLGVQFRFGEPVTSVQLRGDRVHAVITDRERYATPILVNAAGPWAASVGEMVGLHHPVRPESHEAGITEPVAPFLQPMIVDIASSDGAANCYFFQLPTGQLLFSLTPSPPIPGFDCRETSSFLPAASRRMIRLVPRLAGVRVRRTWRGLYPMSPDGSPLVGWSREINGYLMAIGMCGQGFMLGPGLGELLARLVSEDGLSSDDRQLLCALSPYRDFADSERLR